MARLLRLAGGPMSDHPDGGIRLRVCVAVIDDGGESLERRLLLVPHFDTDAGPVQWNLPGGRVRFGEGLEAAAMREFAEETGLQAAITGLLDVSEVLQPEADPPYHSVTIAVSGRVTGGELRAEPPPPRGEKLPRWFTRADLAGLVYHPAGTVEKVLGLPPVEASAAAAPADEDAAPLAPPLAAEFALADDEFIIDHAALSDEVPPFLQRERPRPDLDLPDLAAGAFQGLGEGEADSASAAPEGAAGAGADTAAEADDGSSVDAGAG